MADDEMLLSQDDTRALWDELSHAESREIQSHHRQAGLSSSSSGHPPPATPVTQLRTTFAAALSSAAQVASTAAERAREGYHHLQQQQQQHASSQSKQHHSFHDLAEFGLLDPPSASQPSLDRPSRTNLEIDIVGNSSSQGSLHGSNAPQHHHHRGGYHPPLHQGDMESGDDAGEFQDEYRDHPEARPASRGGSSLASSLLERATKRDFVLLRNFQWLPQRDGWGAVSNLDLFFTSVYNYYYHGGLVPIVGKGIVELASLFFTLWLSVFLFAYLDWSALAQCTDEASCRDTLGSYMWTRPFATWSPWNVVMILYMLLFSAYGVFAVWSFLVTVHRALDTKYFFEDQLGISGRKLEGGAVEWDEIVQAICRLQTSGQYRVAIHGQEINALVVAQHILRKENYMVAFFNRTVLNLRIPLPFPLPTLNTIHHRGQLYTHQQFYSKSLEWTIYFCVFNYMFNHKYKIRPGFYLDPAALRRRFTVCGLAHAIFMPFLLFFMTLHFFMLNVYAWNSTKQYLGPREWSHIAKWTFREFNELPHAFERRMGPSYEAGESYLKLFTQSSAITSLGRLLVFISGSLGAVLLTFAAVNDAILLHVKIGDWNLLWYVGMLGATYAIGKGLLPDPAIHPPYTRNLFSEMDKSLSKVATHTHYYPDVWKKRGWDALTQKAFQGMFNNKAKLFALELCSVILAPILLCTSLRKSADDICEHVQKLKMDVPGAGDMCGYSCFDFDSFQDESWESGRVDDSSDEEKIGIGNLGTSLDTSISETVSSSPTESQSRPKARFGKMEKSLFSFKAAHPTWKCSPSGQNLIDNVETYQHDQTIAIARERQHHIEAAARQLETFTQLERRTHDPAAVTQSRLNEGANMMESYVAGPPPVNDGADVGGGCPISPPHFPDPHAAPFAVSTPSVPRVHFEQRESSFPSMQASQDTLGSLQPVDSMSSSSVLTTPPSLGSTLPNSSGVVNSVLHYADLGLSTELRRILNRSTLDADVSVADSLLMGGGGGMDDEIGSARSTITERQYLWLERYHSHQQSQSQPRQESAGLPRPD